MKEDRREVILIKLTIMYLYNSLINAVIFWSRSTSGWNIYPPVPLIILAVSVPHPDILKFPFHSTYSPTTDISSFPVNTAFLVRTSLRFYREREISKRGGRGGVMKLIMVNFNLSQMSRLCT